MVKKLFNDVKFFLSRTVSTKQAIDTGMAMVLIFLLISCFGKKFNYVLIALLLLVINMTCSNTFKPIAKIWLGISHLLGTVMSKLLLSVIFIVLVVPVGIFRRAMNIDSLQLKQWKKNSESVFKVRGGRVTAEDIQHPY